MYNQSVEDSLSISMDDKKSLCTGITRVLAVLPTQQWLNSLLSLTNPTIECIESTSKVAASINVKDVENENKILVLDRLGEEICILAIAIRTFNIATGKENKDDNSAENPILSVLQRVWPSLTLIASSLCYHHKICASLCELLLVAVSLSENLQNIHLLKNVYEISGTMMASVSKLNRSRELEPIMELVAEIINAFGSTADNRDHTSGMEVTSEDSGEITDIIEQLINRSFIVVNSISSDAQLDILPSLFSLCTYSIQKCPVLFMSLNNEMIGHTNGELFVSSISVAVSSIDQKHVDACRSAMLYLKEVVSLRIYSIDKAYHSFSNSNSSVFLHSLFQVHT